MSPRRNAVRSVKNQYRGINAHLHSLLQQRGDWGSFHTRHLVHLADLLQVALLPMGYRADVEASLQIRRADERTYRPKSDVLISQFNTTATPASTATAQSDVLLLPTLELLDAAEISDKPYRAIVVYALDDESQQRGEPVVWIELLSPSNKAGGEDTEIYRRRRLDLLLSGLVFVEIDYLHETPPTFPALPTYPPGEGTREGVSPHPYQIIVIDPRPTLEKSLSQVAGFDVDVPLPVVDIPLLGKDRLSFDFGTAYSQTYEAGAFGLTLDYAQLPVNFDRYSEADQMRIVQRMLTVLEAAQAGADLEAGAPLTLADVEHLSLEDGLSRLAVLGVEIIETGDKRSP